MRVWFCYTSQEIIGPFSKEEIILKIQKGEITPTDLLSLGTKENWKLPNEWSCFPYTLFPAYQHVDHDPDILSVNQIIWIVLNWNERERRYIHSGPFSADEIKAQLRQKKITLQSYIWKPNLSGWVQLKHRPEFQIVTKPTPIKLEK